jgi:hypothetical protein
MTETWTNMRAGESAANEWLPPWPIAPQQWLFHIAAFPKARRL